MNDDIHLLLEIVRLFYIERYSKTQIAEKLEVSSMQVKRLLDKAHDKGLVRIDIQAPRLDDVREKLMGRFDVLKEALVVPSSNDFIFERKLCAKAAAEYFEIKVLSGMKSVALGGGNTLYDMIKALPYRKRRIDIYPTAMIGRGPNIVLPDRTVIISLLWAKSGEDTAAAYYASILPPENLSSVQELRKEQDKFLKRSIIRQVYDGMLKVDCAFTTIGIVEEHPEYKKLSPQTTIKRLAQMGITKGLKRQGAVGEVSYSFFDIHGNTKPEWKLAIALDADHLKKMVDEKKEVVLVAGKYKEQALKAALKGRMGNVLITDDRTAKELLKR